MSAVTDEAAVTALFQDHPPDPSHDPNHQHMAVQVVHNLRHEHHWTNLRFHTHSASGHRLPRPLISGQPARHVYMHPDDQIDMLKNGLKDQDVPIAREWVLATHLEETWSIKKLANIFDALDSESQTVLEHVDHEKRAGGRSRAKRVLLAILGDDSTVVFYIVHDGIVKPRQN